jgi:hypothetical protein
VLTEKVLLTKKVTNNVGLNNPPLCVNTLFLCMVDDQPSTGFKTSEFWVKIFKQMLLPKIWQEKNEHRDVNGIWKQTKKWKAFTPTTMVTFFASIEK